MSFIKKYRQNCIVQITGWFILLSLIPACRQWNTFAGLIIDVPLAEEQDVVSLAELCNGMEIIPLEANENALLTPIAQTGYRISGDTLFCLDIMTHAVQVFKLTGEHLYTLKRYGRGPGEYMLENEIFVNPYTGTLDLITQMGHIISYDIQNDYQHVKTITISDEIRSVSACALHPSGKGYFFYAPYNPHRQLGYLDLLSGEAHFFDYELDQDLVRSDVSATSTPFSTFDAQILFLESFSGKVFRLDEEAMTMTPHVSFDAGKYRYSKGKEKSGEQRIAAPYRRYHENEDLIFAELIFDKQWLAIVYDKKQDTCRYFHKTAEDVIFTLGEFKGDNMFLLMDPSLLSHFTGSEETFDKGNFLLLKYSINPAFQ